MLLQELWSNQQPDFIMIIMDEFNNQTRAYNVAEMNNVESTAIHNIIFDYCHTLRQCELAYPIKDYIDPNFGAAVYDLEQTIVHSVVELAIEIRNFMKIIKDSTDIGKTHDQITSDPYRGVETINNDRIQWQDLNTIKEIRNYTRSLPILKKIYYEVSTMVIKRVGC